MAQEITVVLRDGPLITVHTVTAAADWIEIGRGTKPYGLRACSADGAFRLY